MAENSIFDGAELIGAQIEDGRVLSVQRLQDGRLCVGSFYVRVSDNEVLPKGGTLMSETGFAALVKQAAQSKTVRMPTARTIKATKPAPKPKAPVKAEVVAENENLKAENEALMARLAAIEAKLAS